MAKITYFIELKNKNSLKNYEKNEIVFIVCFYFLGMSASPPVSGCKSASESRVAAKPQKELPPVAFLRQRHIDFRPCGLSAYALMPGKAIFVLSRRIRLPPYHYLPTGYSRYWQECMSLPYWNKKQHYWKFLPH